MIEALVEKTELVHDSQTYNYSINKINLIRYTYTYVTQTRLTKSITENLQP